MKTPGFLLIDKPAGLTSHDVVDRIRRLTGEKRVGHAGTLDPFATGLLIVAVGREATREMKNFSGLDKDYEAIFLLGAESDTDDRTGKIEATSDKRQVTSDEIEMAMQKFIGEIDQVPPTYAAIKIGGKKMYEAAREGKPIVASPRHVTVHAFNLIEITPLQPLPSLTPLLSLRVHISCSSGTYIRAIARDLGRALKTGAYVEDLRRTRIGPIPLTEAVPLSTLNTETVARYLLPIPTLLARLVPALPTP